MRRVLLTLFGALALLLLTTLWAGRSAGAQPPARAVGWVGNMFPVGGSSNSGNGATFVVYVQVYKDGVTNQAGQGAGIQCFLHWGRVGQAWTNLAMGYHVDTGNNDEYRATVNTAALDDGRYGYTAFCEEGGVQTYQQAGDAFIVVNRNGGTVDQRAFWVAQDVIVWNDNSANASYELHVAPNANLGVPMTVGSGIALTYDGTLNAGSYPKLPNVAGYKAWRIPANRLGEVRTWLQGEVAIAAYNSSGGLIDATGVQLQGVLDALFPYSGELGVSFAGGVPTLRVWAPTARNVTLHRYVDSTTPVAISTAMTRDSATGVWQITGDPTWQKQYYLYGVEVYSHYTGQIETNLVTDPWSVSLSMNSRRSQIVDLYNDPALKPPGWDSLSKPPLARFNDITIYELHVRDFSINDATVPADRRGTFKAFSDPSTAGMQHLIALADAGLTHLHLLPAFDIASVEEDRAQRSEPNPTGARSSDSQQAAVAALRAVDGFNWGYDPYHFGVPEGSYSTNPDGPTRILEFREMVQTLGDHGLRVVMDVVYNHTAANGQADKSVLDKIVPGYYYRMDNSGTVRTTSCCADTASEFAMMEKLMGDTLVIWARAYKVDSFRFDLMNLHTVQNIVNVTSRLRALTPAADGVAGDDIYIYGEGWDFGSLKEKGVASYAKQSNMTGSGIGTFNDKIRDAAHGGLNTDALQIRRQGFINGLSYDWNGFSYDNRMQGDLRYQTDRVRVGLVGGLNNYTLIDQIGSTVSSSGFGGYTAAPQESVNYIDKHDNETLFDLNVFRLPSGTSRADRVRVQNLGMDVLAFGQGVPFFHAGVDMLRSKSLDRNSYDSGDWFNRLDFSYQHNNYAVGLPPAWDNATRWGIMAPLLNDTSIDPTPADIAASVAHLREVLAIRAGSPLFRLPTAGDIQSRVRFYNTGPSQTDGLIVMVISDEVGANLDPHAKNIIVLINAGKQARSYTIGDLAGRDIVLHPRLQNSADPVVRGASYAANGTFSVPARTSAVFVEVETPPIAAGDVTCDGKTDTADALAVLQYDVNLRAGSTTCAPNGTAVYTPACDVNGDGRCDTVDGLLILQCDVAIANELCPTP